MVSAIAQGHIVMKMFIEPADIYLHLEAVDFRKSINGLVVVVEQQLELSPLSDALFIFSNKKRDKLKILYWDKTGFALWYKRLEKQRFKWPSNTEDASLSLSEQQLHWLLGGYDVIGHQTLQYQAVSL
jgi:transposase